MAEGSFRAVARVDLGSLRHNLREARRLAGPGVQIWPAVKADAYGHGLVPVALALQEERVEGFCVATVGEAALLASACPHIPRLVLGALLPGEIAALLETSSETVVCDLAFASDLSRAAASAGKVVDVHLKVDTGMGRLGVRPEQAVETALALDALPGIRLRGIMTHYPCSDEKDLSFSREQTARFARICDDVIRAIGRPLLRHAANSGAILGLPEGRFDAVRPGIMLYGSYPGPGAAPSAQLRPVMTLAARIVFLKDVPAGSTVSYGRTWVAKRPSRIATVSIGYGDGLPRRLSNNGFALVRGMEAPIAGRVCMDMTMLDVTDIPGVRVGEEAVFWGVQRESVLRCDELAWRLGTIPYELTCQVTARVPRVHLR
ncbi:MAG: alanine racemase [Armatimonadota bacterium]